MKDDKNAASIFGDYVPPMTMPPVGVRDHRIGFPPKIKQQIEATEQGVRGCYPTKLVRIKKPGGSFDLTIPFDVDMKTYGGVPHFVWPNGGLYHDPVKGFVDGRYVPGNKHAYHRRDILKGKTGDFSKIQEEFTEALDAFEQNQRLMVLVELGDMLGAVMKFLEKNYPGVQFDDIVRQARLTNEVFARGGREDRDPQ